MVKPAWYLVAVVHSGSKHLFNWNQIFETEVVLDLQRFIKVLSVSWQWFHTIHLGNHYTDLYLTYQPSKTHQKLLQLLRSFEKHFDISAVWIQANFEYYFTFLNIYLSKDGFTVAFSNNSADGSAIIAYLLHCTNAARVIYRVSNAEAILKMKAVCLAECSGTTVHDNIGELLKKTFSIKSNFFCMQSNLLSNIKYDLFFSKLYT